MISMELACQSGFMYCFVFDSIVFIFSNFIVLDQSLTTPYPPHYHSMRVGKKEKEKRKKEKRMAPPGIEPGLTQIIVVPQCVVIPLDHGTYWMGK